MGRAFNTDALIPSWVGLYGKRYHAPLFLWMKKPYFKHRKSRKRSQPDPKNGIFSIHRNRWLREHPGDTVLWAYKMGVFYCPSRRELFECQTCGTFRPLDRFYRNKYIRGKVRTKKCKDCQNRVVCPDPVSQEEANRRNSEAILKWWDKRGRPTDRVNQMDYRERLPEKKDLPPDYPVWE